MNLNFQITASSRVGCVRTNNEDMVLIGNHLLRNGKYSYASQPKDSRLLLALADGMGGHNCGEVASEDTIHNLQYYFEDMPEHLDEKGLRESMENWLRSISLIINAKGCESPMYRNMGTTLVGMLCYEDEYYWFNCGDSRLYRLHGDKFEQLTTDHSLSQAMGLSTHSSQITNCIGGGTTECFIDMERITDFVQPGDIFMLCSDGLTDMINDDEIKRLLAMGFDADALCEAAEDAGGYDNVSVVVIKVE